MYPACPSGAASLALKITVLAKPTIGGRSGNGQWRCLTVYPKPRRSGAAISIRLHTVGVSIDFSKSSWLDVTAGMRSLQFCFGARLAHFTFLQVPGYSH